MVQKHCHICLKNHRSTKCFVGNLKPRVHPIKPNAKKQMFYHARFLKWENSQQIEMQN